VYLSISPYCDKYPVSTTQRHTKKQITQVIEQMIMLKNKRLCNS